ncbi:uncharacterized protein LOC128550967 [Mercenaria mercenaria]|uniref:uncharacterized protein LOC128550967 n=1 Tax=Mercenaria mercenaria TaxID=6596 RepID=UPI00234F4BED|nr:uncharacterized protein LOC128550967 [Mercenaria mercenaria]
MMMKKFFGKKNGKKPPTQDQHAAEDTRNNRPPGNPDTGAVGATGGSLTLDKSGLMKTQWMKLEQTETGTKQKMFHRKSGKKPLTQDQNAAGDTGNNRPLVNPSTDAVGATGGSLTLDKSGLMKTQWRKLEQNEKWTKQVTFFSNDCQT